jgi:lipopolysaccharide transport system ATP-binding protein
MTKEIASKINEEIIASDWSAYMTQRCKIATAAGKRPRGFAVAAFLEPEILIIDEVLAVGDAEF